MPPSETPTVQQAFDQAKAEHSAQEQAPPESKSSTAAAADTSTTQDTDTAPGASSERATESTDLVSDADFQAIQAKFPNDPVKQRAELNRVFTQKTQELAALRKPLEAQKDLLDALESDPTKTITQLAEQLGLKISPSSAETKVTETAATAVDTALESFRQALGPELDFLADKLGPAMKSMAENIAKTVIDQNVGPLKQQQETLLSRAAAEQTAATMKTFGEKHPDWKTHEPAMVKLMGQLQPNGMAEADYLDLLYQHVTRDTTIADAVKKAMDRITKGAKDADTGDRPTSETKVTDTPPRMPSVMEAFQAAKRGERWS